jgi:NADH:ubiquinone oxidoreductase subunit C
MTEFVTTLRAVPGATVFDHRTDGLWMTAPALDVVALATAMKQLGGRLSTMTAVPLENGETTIIYHYCIGRDTVNIKTRTRERALPSLAALTPSANWIEREIHDLYAVDFVGHPGLLPLVRPPTLSAGFFRRTEVGPAPERQ